MSGTAPDRPSYRELVAEIIATGEDPMFTTFALLADAATAHLGPEMLSEAKALAVDLVEMFRREDSLDTDAALSQAMRSIFSLMVGLAQMVPYPDECQDFKNPTLASGN